LLLEECTRALIDNAKEIIGGELFEGDAHAFLMSIYKDKSLPLNLRLDAAKSAIRYEKPAMTVIDARSKTETVLYAISDKPMSLEEWAVKYTGQPLPNKWRPPAACESGKRHPGEWT
jgi:hypothetical protein